MAEFQALPKSSAVQELVRNGDDMPDKYVYKDGHGGSSDASLPLLDVPIIDLDILLSSEEELDKLRSALCSSGCFQGINHGMDNTLIDELREIAKQFFALPMEEKRKYSREEDDMQGYGNDPVQVESQILDWTDRLFLITTPQDKLKLKHWPEKPQNFRRVLHEYSKKIEMLNEIILKAMAKSLKLQENCFLDQYGEQATVIARFCYYPPCPRPDLALGLKPHADGSATTFVLPDREVQGLQFERDNQWTRISINPYALLVNIGDQAEIMSNGIFKSAVHRVVLNSQQERTSVAVFCLPHPDKEIEPAEDLVNEERPRMYKKVTNYIEILFDQYQQGKKAIDAVKL